MTKASFTLTCRAAAIIATAAFGCAPGDAKAVRLFGAWVRVAEPIASHELPRPFPAPGMPFDHITLPKPAGESITSPMLVELLKPPKPDADAMIFKAPKIDSAVGVDRETRDILRKNKASIFGVAAGGADLGIDVIHAFLVDQYLEQSAHASGGLFDIMHVTRVDDPARSSLYYVQSHGSPAKLIDTAWGLVAETNRIGAKTDAKSVYIFVDGPSPVKDARALELSLRNLKRSVQTPIVVAREPLPLAIGSLALGISAFDLASAIKGPTTLSRRGAMVETVDGYQQDFKLATGRGSTTISIFARSRAMLEKFYRILLNLFSAPQSYDSLSYLAVFQMARKELAHDLGMTLDEVDREIGVNTQNSQLAMLFDTEAARRLVVASAFAP